MRIYFHVGICFFVASPLCGSEDVLSSPVKSTNEDLSAKSLSKIFGVKFNPSEEFNPTSDGGAQCPHCDMKMAQPKGSGKFFTIDELCESHAAPGVCKGRSPDGESSSNLSSHEEPRSSSTPTVRQRTDSPLLIGAIALSPLALRRKKAKQEREKAKSAEPQ